MAIQAMAAKIARHRADRGELWRTIEAPLDLAGASGQEWSDEIVLGMLEERLTAGDTGNGFILDGYPRNLAQANALDALLARLGQPVDIAVQLDVDTELLIGRLAGRAQAEGRADDSPDAVRKRLAVYEEATAPVVDFYRNSGRLACVDGVGAVDVVLQRILAALAPTPEVG